jgi:hypothetical protein
MTARHPDDAPVIGRDLAAASTARTAPTAPARAFGAGSAS